MPELRTQFVLLRHTGGGSTHWDLMIDTGAALATWQVGRDPCPSGQGAGVGLPARRLTDHRRAYLDYEGPVSGNRGVVARVDRGECRILESDAGRWTIRLGGELMTGTFRLTAQDPEDESWLLERVGD